jgi:hypothetical protein
LYSSLPWKESRKGMTEKKFQEFTIWGENGERDLLVLVKNVMGACSIVMYF